MPLCVVSQSAQNNPYNSDQFYFQQWLSYSDSLFVQSKSTSITTPKMVVEARNNFQEAYWIDLLERSHPDLPLRYDARVGEILKFYLQHFNQSSFAMAKLHYQIPAFDLMLQVQKLPLSLHYMPFALSAMYHKAQGKTGSKGVWLLNYSVAKREGLQVDSYVDDRLELNRSSRAAIFEIMQLHRLYSNWELAIGAYACGPANINKSIRRLNNNQDFYALYPILPDFGRDIVPALTAAYLFDRFLESNSIALSNYSFSLSGDTVEVSRQLYFKKVSETLNISIDSLRLLNPRYKMDVIPALNVAYPLVLPKGKMMTFIQFEDSLFSSKDSIRIPATELANINPIVVAPAQNTASQVSNSKVPIYYHIKAGDNLGMIADWYDVNLNDLQSWNRVDPRKLAVNQKIKVMVPESKENYYRSIDDMSRAEKQRLKQGGGSGHASQSNSGSGTWTTYTVKAGDTPYKISKKYSGVSPEDILKWNHISDPTSIQVGQKLKIRR